MQCTPPLNLSAGWFFCCELLNILYSEQASSVKFGCGIVFCGVFVKMIGRMRCWVTGC